MKTLQTWTELKQTDNKLVSLSIKGIQASDRDLSGRVFSQCSLESSDFDQIALNSVRALESSFNGLSLHHASISDGIFIDCLFEHWFLNSSFQIRNSFTRTRFQYTAAELSTFAQSTFDECTFSQSHMSEVSFIGTVWRNCRFTDEEWFFVRFPDAFFLNTHFINCNFQKGIFRKARFQDCVFDRCTLTDSVFHNAALINTKFKQTDLEQAANTQGLQIL